jgi:hypothetical protein
MNRRRLVLKISLLLAVLLALLAVSGRSVSRFAGAEAGPEGGLGIAGRAGITPCAGALTGSAERRASVDRGRITEINFSFQLSTFCFDP